LKAGYRFLKIKNGVTAFAAIEIDFENDDEWSIHWACDESYLESIYQASVSKGLSLVKNECEKKCFNVHPKRVTILSMGETVSDTKQDAVMCCTAIALWKSLGFSEADVVIDFVADEWSVSFDGAQRNTSE